MSFLISLRVLRERDISPRWNHAHPLVHALTMSADLATCIHAILHGQDGLSAREIVKLLPSEHKGVGAKGRVNAYLYASLKNGTLRNEMREATPVWRLAGSDGATGGCASAPDNVSAPPAAPPAAPPRPVLLVDTVTTTPGDVTQWLTDNGHDSTDNIVHIRRYTSEDEHRLLYLTRDYLVARQQGHAVALLCNNTLIQELLQETVRFDEPVPEPTED